MRLTQILVLVSAVILLDLILENLFATRHLNEQRVEVVEKLSLVRARLEGTLYSNLHLLNGMSAAISTNPEFSEQQFNSLADKLLLNRNALRNIAAAPDLVIRYVYPLEGNQAALGLDYNKVADQRDAALKARDLNTMVIAGPVQLVQGGIGLIVRLPVFYRDNQNHPKFWGIVSSVIHTEKLYQQAGLLDRQPDIELAIRGRDSLGPHGDIFFGDPQVFETSDVRQQVILPYGSWQMVAQPQGGWVKQSPYRWFIRGGSVLLTLLALATLGIRNRQRKRERFSQATFFAAFEDSPLGMAISDPKNGDISHINQSLRKMSSLPATVLDAKGQYQHLPESVERLLKSENYEDGQEITLSNYHGEERSWRCFHSNLQTPDGPRLLSLFQDITEHRQLLEQLQLSQLVIDHTSDAVIITDANTRIIQVNEAFSRISGYDRDEMIGLTPAKYSSGYHDKAFYQAMWQRINQTGAWNGELWNRKASGEVYPAWITINRIGDPNDPHHRYIGVFSDISNIKQTEKELERMAYYDPLTGLPNRTLFQERLKHEILSTRRHQGRLALLFLDLDRFKHVNDSFGHSVGDELLKVVAGRLSSEVRENDTVTRLGGDEFTVIVSELSDIDSATALVERMLKRIQEPIELVGQQLHVGASIGIALYPDDGEDAETLLRHADMAMYQAKEQGRNSFHYFTQKLQDRASSRLMLENQLREAIEKQQFALYYQPKLELHSRRVLGMEALIRWHHPTQGLISPADFIPVAEETGLIVPLGQWVLEEACRQTQEWHQQGFTHLRVSVNLSARQFAKADLVEDVRKTLERTKLSTDALELEITESMVVDASSSANEKLVQLRQLGVEISIDDFGTGYSNLQYLKRFPLTSLKIDRGFVRDLMVDREDAAIIKAIILMARGLGLNVIAEGVETQEQLDFLLEHRCPMGQGFLFSPPLPADKFIEWIDSTELDFDTL
ncbi:EAL domain-containing protein [Motiliproteus coralliicola]|uniref:cyclic-guanylate-specific phosphodiesterase n=1 Tax=Motiliproteus coralliicola TaxID=2283196 RepID=A0A369WRL1_9GAMM|nr:EAL domain-containing protein [Motiliproteus coralliicola]RDE24758.1 EAL domain-containing protein [Motiliproteus coralliicola]